jgi:tetratricopeptide (TPR) repeat protein
MGNEQWAEAVVIFRQYLKGIQEPVEKIPLYGNLASCYLEQGLYEETLAIWDEVAGIAEDLANLWFGRAVAYGCSGQPEKAIKAFEQFRLIAPEQSRLFEINSMIEELQQEQQGEIAPGSFLYEHLDAQLEDNIDLGDYDLVVRKARQMIDIIPGRPEGHFALGLALLRQSQMEEAIVAFLEAHSREPDYAPTIYNIGYIYFELNQLDQALLWLERALQQDETYVEALHLKGRIYKQLDQQQEAVALWRQTLSINPAYEPAQYALFEAGAGPEPEEESSELPQQLHRMGLLAKARMSQPRSYRSGDVKLTVEPGVGFVLEDAENEHNGTVYAGRPFRIARMGETDILYFVGVLKLLVRLANKSNCRDMAILAYSPDHPPFVYGLTMKEDMLENDSHGRLLSDVAPHFLKVRVDSTLESPYGSPFHGYFIYLKQGAKSGIAVLTFGLLED